MAQVSERCPHCGNIVEGHKVKSYVNKLTRQGAKSAAHSITGVGAMGTGAAIGSVILPGIGTVIGGALGFLGSAMFNQKVNEKIDKTIDKVEDDYLIMDYEFTCPNCGQKWVKNEQQVGIEDVISRNFEIIILTVSQVTGVEVERIFPKSNLCDDLGADDAKKECILQRLEQELGMSTEKDADSFIFVDDLIEAFLGVSMWDLDVASHDEETEKLQAVVDSYFNKEFDNAPIQELAEKLKECANTCEEEAHKAQYHYLIAIVLLEHLLKCDDTDSEHLTYCIEEGDANIQVCRGLFQDDNEYLLVAFIYYVLKCLYIDESFTKDEDLVDLLEVDKDEVVAKCRQDSENFMIDPERLFCLLDTVCQRVKEGNKLQPNEQEYFNELKEMLADGEIGPRERKLLEKIRTRLDVSEERAFELESSLMQSSSLSEEEQEYLKEYREIASEGVISPRDQRFLEKLKKVNGISDERANEIESML